MPQTPAERIEKLAQYFTGPAVAYHSVSLQMGGDRKIGADAFFEARNALGLSGWTDKDTAIQQIASALGVSL